MARAPQKKRPQRDRASPQPRQSQKPHPRLGPPIRGRVPGLVPQARFGRRTPQEQSPDPKRASTRRRQQGEVALTRTRQQTRSPANTIRQLYDRTLPKGRLGADYLYKIRGLFNAFPHGPTRRAFLDILLQAARRADLFRLDPVVPAFGAHPDNNFIDGLAALARHAEDWVRPVAEWVPPSHNPRKQFHHLACHLLARYDVPTFMDAAFFTAAMPEAGLHQAWFKHIGSGAEHPHRRPPRRLEQKSAHCFLAAPDDLSHRPRPALGPSRGTRRQSSAGASDNCHPAGSVV